MPINIHPITPPTGAPKPRHPNVKLRMRPGGKVMPMIATMLGIISAAPMPLIARAIENCIIPRVQNPLIRDQVIHQKPPRKSIFLWPYTAPIRPETRTNAPWVSLVCELA